MSDNFHNTWCYSSEICSTPIFTGDGEGGSGFAAAAAAAAAGGGSGYDFGVDPNLDPELALALRVSMEEERARQEAAAKKAAEESAQEKGEMQSTSQDITMTENVGARTSETENKAADLMVGILLFWKNPMTFWVKNIREEKKKLITFECWFFVLPFYCWGGVWGFQLWAHDIFMLNNGKPIVDNH